MVSVSLSGVTVAYPVPAGGRQRSALAAAARTLSFGRLAQDASGVAYVLALNRVSLDIKSGARVGIIGRNGSGKSTLLKTIAGIVLPQTGVRRVEGSIGCLLNFGAGTDPEKTGAENLKLIGRLYGLRGAELDAAVANAAEFCELGPFLDLPMRTYSSGMSARICFAIATARRSEVLLIDEVIGTGDAHFVGKARRRIETLCEGAGLSVVATHSYDILSAFCDTAVWLDAAEIKAQGPVDEVWAAYSATAAAA